MDPESIRNKIVKLASDGALLREENLWERNEALDTLDLAEEMVLYDNQLADSGETQAVASELRTRLEAIDAALFARLRAYIRSPQRTREGVRRLLNDFTDYRPGGQAEAHLGWDGLDLLLDGVLETESMHMEPASLRHPEMVHYEPTPARTILDLVDTAKPQAGDVFYDLGSGLGQVAILYHLVTGLTARGVEIEPGYVRLARASARGLGLTGVRFLEGDVRQADLSPGTLFFMFTPFVGEMMRAVLERLEGVAARHPLRLCTYGSCTMDVARERWLRIQDPERLHAFKLAVFESVLA